MSVLIKDMEMPESCFECRLFNDPWCMAKNRNQWRTAYNRPPKWERQNDCPLVPVPLHGRLGDLDELARKIEHDRYYHTHTDGMAARHHIAEYGHFLKEIADIPTIIPASEEVYDKYTDTAGNLHWTGTHSGAHNQGRGGEI